MSILIHTTVLFSVSLYGSNSPVSRQELFDVDLVAPKEQKGSETRTTVPPAPDIQATAPRQLRKTNRTAAVQTPVIKESLEEAPLPLSEKEATVSLDSAGNQPSRYDPYLQHLRGRINAEWKYPSEAQQQQLSGSLTLRFSIAHNGNLIGVWMLRSSGSDILDREALRTIHDAAPFKPLPSGLAIERLNVLASFDYQFAP